MLNRKYVIISPMKNEERYVRRTLQSIVTQTVLPEEWAIVNDGSTDRSPEIVSEYCRKYSWIRMINSELSRRSRGGHVVELFYKGLEALATKDFSVLVKLDCDLSVSPEFFAIALSNFAAHPRLGITSGISHIEVNHRLIEERSVPGHTLGATKIYRVDCFKEIGGLVRSMGWDGIDEIKARMLGWEARSLRELVVIHHRQEGKQLGTFRSGIERGKGSHFMGYHPLYLSARVLKQMLRPGYFADGAGMLAGYLSAMWRTQKTIHDPEFVHFLRKNQLRKLLGLRNEI